ncbi:condensation domain-containing protein [Mesorhizobium australicum]|uniref:condensation domain-containing protein n=1 Tax=Mesorhizobium australicum TaxID=536018 RepID=UPI0033354A7C
MPLSFPQQQLWFIARLAGGGEACHIQMGLWLHGELGEAALQSALSRLVASHEGLRTPFAVEDGEPFHRIGPADVGLPLKRDDLTAAVDLEATLAELIRNGAQAAFDLEAGRPVRLAVGDNALLTTMLDMVSDNWSRKILTRELYAAAREGSADRLIPLPAQYADDAVCQWVARDLSERHSKYWLRMLAGAPAVFKLPTDQPRPAQQDYSGSYVALQEALTAPIKSLSLPGGMMPCATLLAGRSLVLGLWSGQDELVIGTASANRTRSNIEGLIGLLKAAAFDIVGFPIGLAILSLVILVTVALRPLVKADHRFARVAMLLSLAAALLFASLMTGNLGILPSFATLCSFRLTPCARPAKASQIYTIQIFAKRSGARSRPLGVLIVVPLTSLPDKIKLFLPFPKLPLVQAGSFFADQRGSRFPLLEEASLLAAWTAVLAGHAESRRAVAFDQLQIRQMKVTVGHIQGSNSCE